MAIFTPADAAIYAPSLGLNEIELSAAIAQAQFLVESPIGANRILEIQQHVEVASLKTDGIVRVRLTPLVSVESIAYKNWYRNNNDWIVVDPTKYTVDTDLAEIAIAPDALLNISGIDPWGIMDRRIRPTKPDRNWDVKIKYTAGFDFLVDTPEVVAMKSAIAGILKIRQSKAAEGIQSFEWNDWYKISFGAGASDVTSSGVGASPFEDFLLIFRKYRSRSLPT